jgi:hypothetical protein
MSGKLHILEFSRFFSDAEPVFLRVLKQVRNIPGLDSQSIREVLVLWTGGTTNCEPLSPFLSERVEKGDCPLVRNFNIARMRRRTALKFDGAAIPVMNCRRRRWSFEAKLNLPEERGRLCPFTSDVSMYYPELHDAW